MKIDTILIHAIYQAIPIDALLSFKIDGISPRPLGSAVRLEAILPLAWVRYLPPSTALWQVSPASYGRWSSDLWT